MNPFDGGNRRSSRPPQPPAIEIPGQSVGRPARERPSSNAPDHVARHPSYRRGEHQLPRSPPARSLSGGPLYGEAPGGSFAAYATAASPPPPPPHQQPYGGSSPQQQQGGQMRPGFGAVQSISFQEPLRGDNLPRSGPSRDSVKSSNYGADAKRSSVGNLPELPRTSSGYSPNDPEAGFSGSAQANFRRKKSLVRPDRERMDPNHRQWYYRNHAAQMDAVDSQGAAARVGYMPSTTGHLPQHGAGMGTYGMQGPGGGLSGLGVVGPNAIRPQPAYPANVPPGGLGRPIPAGATGGGAGGLRRGKSILGRDEDNVESGINFLKRGLSLRRSRSQSRPNKEGAMMANDEPKKSKIAPGPIGPWMIYCYILTICIPPPVLNCFGIRKPEQQRAWREKMGLMGIIAICMLAVGFLTFGFTQVVCGTPPTRYVGGKLDVGSIVFDGYDYDFDKFIHPLGVGPFQPNSIFNNTNPTYSQPWMAGSNDATLLFQRVGGACTNFIKTKNNAQPTSYLSCSLLFGTNGTISYSNATQCHPATTITDFYSAPAWQGRRRGQVYYTWENVTNPARNLGVWKGSVLDYSRLSMLNNSLSYPTIFNTLKVRNDAWAGRDVTAGVIRSKQDDVFNCIEQVTRVGFIDSESIGCVASKVELYLSLVFIIGVVAIKFFMAVVFGWFISWRLGNYANETYEQRMKRAAEIEQWSSDIYRPAPAGYRPNVVNKRKSIFPTTSRFSVHANAVLAAPKSRPATMIMTDKTSSVTHQRGGRLGVGSPHGTPPGSPSLQGGRSSASLPNGSKGMDYSSHGHGGSRRSSFSDSPAVGSMGPCPFPLINVVPQPGPDYQPFNFPLAYSICLVTAYSESFEGLRTTLDSLATTDYPNSHKLILVIADGIVKGAGSDISTPDICLSMMKDLVVPAEEVEGNSYVAIADGFRRHNMAKVYAGFYEYDDETVERSKQQRVPMILVAKCGTPMEADSAKPGNRGKRDSQVMLMAFMQKVMFDERMTYFEYEFFNSIWRVTGMSPDHFEIVLMVDADTKVFPDSLSRMVACMVEDPEIMGLCGETKIANKSETWVTMIQVFEYYISHHQTKAFEACFGGVTCLPGCFSAYRIKAPKGPNGYWVPILANPDIVEHYSENVVDTLHKKNLLLLGEDRYLTTLMLKTFPKRKMMFVPQAVCKTVVPDTFRILLSQRRRWINSTVHNLGELLLVNDLCGTFCFSMRFVIFMELAGTLVLPAAIAFTLYVIAQAIDPHKPTPVIPLILLLIILGLPGLLIIVTSRKIAYVGWMLIYLLSLPLWNFVLPAYAFWHMDDFSWGATRIVQGDKGQHHGDAEGKFDPSNIVMKRWAEFERDRRWKSGTHSRDSTYDVVQRTGSPERSGSTRYSVVSSDTYHSNPSTAQHEAMYGRGGPSAGLLSHQQDGSDGGHVRGASGARARLDTVPLLELPAPLGPSTVGGKPRSSPPGSVTVTRPRDSSPASGMVQRHSNSPRPYGDSSYAHTSNVEVDEEKRPMMGSGASSPDPESRVPPLSARMSQLAAAAAQPQVRHGSANEERHPVISEAAFTQAYMAEPEEMHPSSATSRLPPNAIGAMPQALPRPPREAPPTTAATRGFSLVDDGPVATSAGVRQVTRGAKRMSGQPSPISPQHTGASGTPRRGHQNNDSLASNNAGGGGPR